MKAIVYSNENSYSVDVPFTQSEFRTKRAEWTRNFCKQIVNGYYTAIGQTCTLRLYNDNGVNIASFKND